VPEIENKKSEKTFRSSIFRVMEPVYRLIALWGPPQRRVQKHSRSPQERDNAVVEDNFQRFLQKKIRD
jgi:hypothetical protein